MQIQEEQKKTAKELAQQAAEVIVKANEAPINTDFVINDKHDHKSGKGIYAISKPVKNYKQVKDIVERMIVWLDTNNGRFENKWKTAYAISHCQVADEPFNFFIVMREMLGKNNIEVKGETKAMNKKNYYFPAQAIFNAVILETPEKMEATIPKREVTKDKDGKVSTQIKLSKGTVSNLIPMKDACMSFPNKTEKNTDRYYRIKVQYQIKSWYGLKKVTEWVEGLKAHIFQHEIDHAKAINMYYSKK